jgi:hypothetical protein
VLPFRKLLFKRIKRRIKLRKKLEDHPSEPKTAVDRDDEFLGDLEIHDLSDQRLSHDKQDMSFE